MPAAIPPDIAALLVTGSGVLSRRDAERAGISPDRLEHLTRTGLLYRPWRGHYAGTAQRTAWEAYALRVRAVQRAAPPDAYATRSSALPAYRLPVLGPPPGTVVHVRPKQEGAWPVSDGARRILVAELPEQDRRMVDGLRVCSPARVAADLARTSPMPPALVAADAVLHHGLATPAELADEAGRQADWPGGRKVLQVVTASDGGAETPLESLGRLSCIEAGLPVPLSNVWVGDGRPEFRLDHLWPYAWLAGEGDGWGKYGDPNEIWSEKEREWRLRRLGLDVVRYGWRLAHGNRPELAARFLAALSRPGIPAEPITWWPTRDAREPGRLS